MSTVKLRPHQVKAVQELENGKILKGGVGSGKTITSLFYYFERVCGGVVGDFGSMKTPKDVYVITTARKRDTLDWQREALKLGISRDPAASPSGVKIVVDSWNNIDKYKEVKGAFFIFDEQRLVGSGAWVKSFIKTAKSNEWILLSATPGDTWLDYIPVFVANGFYQNRTEFKRRHVVYNTYSKFPKVDRYLEVGLLVRLKNHLLVEMPYEKHTKRHIKEVIVDYSVDLFEKVVKKRWHVYEDRPLRGVAELFSVMRKVVNTDSSRLRVIQDLLSTHPRLIVFYNFDYELEMLRTLKVESSSMDCTSPSMPSTQSVVESNSGSQTEMLSNSTSATGRLKNRDCATTMTPALEKPVDNDQSSVDHSFVMTTAEKNSQVSKTSTSSTSSEIGRCESWPIGKLVDTTSSDTSEGGSISAQVAGVQSQKKSAKNGTTRKTNSTKDSRSTLQIAEWNGHKHEEVPTGDHWVYLVQYAAGAEAWNCTETNAMVFYSLTYSYKHFEQGQGRIDRLDTPFTDLYYYVFMSMSAIDKAVWKALKMKKSFNERKFVANT